jgi:hypothetical protein
LGAYVAWLVRRTCWDGCGPHAERLDATLAITIDKSGRVSSARPIGDLQVGACVDRTLSALRLPPRTDARPIDVPHVFDRIDPPSPEETTNEPFDRGAAAAALASVNLKSCKASDGPAGTAHVSVTFAPDGRVERAVVDRGPFAGTKVGDCIAGKFRTLRIPPFAGGRVTVGKELSIP